MLFRSRFTIAHELGHFLMHDPKARAYAARGDTGRIEWEANWFAAGFLMPTKQFKELKVKGFSSEELAGYFHVSRQAAEIRYGEI